ncbi:MAG: class I SAM-dependent methyltransferase [Limisphaerales bacterium]
MKWFFIVGFVGVPCGFIFRFAIKPEFLPWAHSVARPCFSIGWSALISGSVMLWGSKAGKLHLRDKIISSISWRGDEMVLDVGCGHGLMLIGAAKRLTSGKAVGIDLWQKEDQSDNSRESTLKNVRLENVAERVELLDGDARKLPFADNSFDVVLSSWALHNIYDRAERDGAVREIVRVLKPGGRLIIADIRHTGQYAKVLQQSRMLNIQRGWPNFLFVTPTFTLTAIRPNSSG